MFKNFGEKLGLGMLGILGTLLIIASAFLLVGISKAIPLVLAFLVVAYALGSLMYRKGFRLDKE